MAEEDRLVVGAVEDMAGVDSTVDSIVVGIHLVVPTAADTEVEAEDTPLTRMAMACFTWCAWIPQTFLLACSI